MIKKIKLIIALGRLRFLAGGFFLYTMGVLLAINSGVEFSFLYFIFGYAIMLPAHLSLSYSNNYFDTEVDQFNKPISISGGTKILIENPELRSICKKIAIGLIIISVLLAFIFIFIFSFPITFLGFIIFGNLLGWFYTAPPIRLAYRGLGEIANMINMGFLMPGIGYWTMSRNLDLFFLIFAIAFLIYGLNFMIIVETPDMEGDKKAKKKTLVTKIGRKNSYKITIVCLLCSSIYFLIIAYRGLFNTNINYFIIFSLSLIPLVIAIFGWFKKPFSINTASKIAQNNMYALLFLIFLINVYFLINIYIRYI
ncbi:MAG: prenyltransferase [Thermoplasmatales archaeon]|nr:MAG: prenyltransferase [Thermoplasmatales archaeon]